MNQLRFRFFNFPMPQTSNHQYTPVRGRLIKSYSSRKYTAEVEVYYLQNINLFQQAYEHLNGKLLTLNMYFVFPYSKVYTKKKEIKKLDYANRVKQAQDEFCRHLKIDDKYIKSGRNELLVGEKEYMILDLYEHERIRVAVGEII